MLKIDLLDLFARITIDDSDYKKGINEASDKTNSFSSLVVAKGAVIASAFTGAFKAGASAVKKLAEIGLAYNSQMETYTTNFQVMLGSQEAATKKVEELKKMAAATPFEMSDLASATQTLLSFGISSDKTQGIMKQLGDVSLGNAEKFSSLSLVYGQVASNGKLMGQDLLQMINSGFNPLQVISQKTGESMASLKDKMSKGEITIKEVDQAFQWATESGGQFYGGMEQGAKTTSGLISTLKDNVTSKIGELFQGVSDKAKGLLPSIISFVDSIDVSKVLTSLTNLGNTFASLLPTITAVAAAAVAYKGAVAISGVIDALTKATEGQTIAQGLLNAVMNANPFVLVATLIAGVIAALVTLYATNEDFRNKVKAIWADITGFFSTAANTVKSVWNSIPQFFSGVIQGIKDKFNGIITAAKNWGSDMINNFVAGIKAKFEAVKSSVKSVAQTVKDFLGFSEPSKGPLSNFHTYAPDMMELFAKGIKDNEGLVTGQIDKSFSFGTRTVGFSSSAQGISSAGIINGVSTTAQNTGGIFNVNLVMPDGMKIASYLINPLITAAKFNGTPIANPVV